MDLNEMLKEAQKLQQDMESIQKELETEEILVANDTGTVRTKITGSGEFTAFMLDEQFLKGPKETVEKELLETCVKAVKESRKKHEEAMKKITASLSLPSLDELKSGMEDLKLPNGPTRRSSSDYKLHP